MTHQIRENKRSLRRELMRRLGILSPAFRETASAQARDLLREQVFWRHAGSVLFYAPMPGELDVWPLLVEALGTGKSVALPWFNADTGLYEAKWIQNPARDIQMGHFGIREPAEHCPKDPLMRLDFILVPGVGYDLQGRRLGRGKGFYDRLLGAVRGRTCGVCFDEQVVETVPVEPHDKQLDCILTPTRWCELYRRTV